MDPYTAPTTDITSPDIGQLGEYASFLKRLGAAFIDGIITTVAAFIVGCVVGLGMGALGLQSEIIEAVGNLVGIVISWLYYALQESSEKQASLGKQLLKIKVSDLEGNRISFARASGRHFGKILSSVILFIGYFMMFFTNRKQTLHDMISGCIVTENNR